MKKILCILLIFSVVLLTGCMKKEPEVKDALLSDYLERMENFETVDHQYGEEKSRVLFGEKMVATVLYPETGIADMDTAIEKYIDSAVTSFQVESAEKKLAEPAELLIYYNSYINKNGTVSVEIMGTYFDYAMAHPIDLVKTFVADGEEGKLIEIDDILAEGKREVIENKLIEEFGINREFGPGNLLEWWIIVDDCLKVILPRGEFLPMSDGTKSYTFTEKETKDFLKDGKSEGSVAVNQKEEDKTVVTEAEDVKVDPSKPMLALTFDDGPSAHTQRLLDIFAEYGGKGTFFVLGNTLDNRKDTLKRMVAEGHEIGNHSWSHRQFTNISIDEVKDQIMMTRAKIYDITGIDCTIVRPPYGACNDEIRALGKEIGVSYVNS